MAAKEKVVLDFDPIQEEEETKCSDDLWNCIEAHEDELEEPEDITKSLMKLSELSLRDFLAGEPDIYTVRDLKVRYR
jgi:hypothetical protein